MGMYDEIRWDAALPDGHPPDDRMFQTKSLHPCLERYLVTSKGRLLLVGNGLQDEPQLEASEDGGPPIDVDFHGDIRIFSVQNQRAYLVRFTHGALEWIKPLGDNEPWDSVAAASMKFYANQKDTSRIADAD